MAKKTPMTPKAARRIQSAADRGGKSQTFKGRAQRAAAKNTSSSKGSAAGKGSGSK